MKHSFIAVLLFLLTLTTTAQTKMRSVDELINKTDPGWPIVEGWIKSAKNKVEVLPVDSAKAKRQLGLDK